MTAEESADVAEGSDFGLVDLEVHSASKGSQVTGVPPRAQYSAPTCALVTERSAMKKGSTVALEKDGKTIMEKSFFVNY